jgi:hypothetical protein
MSFSVFNSEELGQIYGKYLGVDILSHRGKGSAPVGMPTVGISSANNT